VAEFWRDDRAVSSVVEKLLGAGIAVLYIGGMMGLLLGGVVPGYQAAAGEQLGERTLATAAGEIEQTIPQVAGDVNATTTVDLPDEIRGASYRLMLANGTLRLAHPDGTIRDERRLALPAGTQTRQSTWTSGETLVIQVTGETDSRTVTLEES
jgi:hypothetical protein